MIIVIAFLAVIFNRLIPGHVKVNITRSMTGLITHPVGILTVLTSPFI